MAACSDDAVQCVLYISPCRHPIDELDYVPTETRIQEYGRHLLTNWEEENPLVYAAAKSSPSVMESLLDEGNDSFFSSCALRLISKVR